MSADLTSIRILRSTTTRNVILLAFMLLACGPNAFALDPALDVSQYAHTTWKIREGFFKGQIISIAQTPDGYLWLGTEFGLLRFDGVRNVPWQAPPNQHLPSSAIWSLLAARDGTLWIGTSKGLASWKGGKLTQYSELAGRLIFTLVEDREGTVWASGGALLNGTLCAIRNSGVQCYGDDGRFGHAVFKLYEDSKGSLWAGVSNGLWRWKPGPPKFYAMPGEPDGIQSFGEDDDGTLLLGMHGGIRRLVDGKTELYPLPGTKRRFWARRQLRDRDGGLWIGASDEGLVHVHQGRTDVFTASDGLSGEDVYNLFEDREGNIWVTTPNGLDRFRDFAVATLTVNQGLSNASVSSVLAARDGTVWLGTNGGLNIWNNGQITIYGPRKAQVKSSAQPTSGHDERDGKLNGRYPNSLFQDDRGRIWASTQAGFGYLEDGRFVSISSIPGTVNSFTQDSGGTLWIANERGGLFQLQQERVVQQIPWARLGRKDFASTLTADVLQGGLWIGFVLGGVAYFSDGQVRASYAVGDGLGEGRVGEGRVNAFLLDQDGALWAATEGGLSRLKNGGVATLTSEKGLPCDTVHWVIEDDVHSLWLYMACGLVRIARLELDAWATAVDKDKNSKRTIQATLFDTSDGVRSLYSAGHYSPQVAKSSDGRLWFLPWDGVSVVDPRHLPFNKLPPPVHIEQIIADRKRYDPTSAADGHVRLPSRIRDLEIDYTALSLVAPEKVLFRYKLEGKDSDWQDVGTRRQAFYNDLPPGNYRFRVIASNNSGVWNEAGTLVDFAVAPAYYQTTWFRLSGVAAFLALLGVLHQLRLRHVSRQFKTRMDERTRIAQDLHDTLLQGCLSASMQLNLAVDRLPADLPVGDALNHVQQVMARVIDEGRSAVRGLRVADPAALDLEQAFYRAHRELDIEEHVGFRIIVEGKRRPVHPLIRDDVYRIGREAIVNAFRHAHAQHIEVEIEYAPKLLRVLVRDDGCGIDPSVVSSGRDGHWGLSGMRERAERIGGRVSVSSRNTAGTEVDLSVPGKVAFQVEPSVRRLWLAKLIRKAPQRKTP